MTKLKQRIGALTKVTGSQQHPRASKKLGISILKSMVISLTQYAPTILVQKTDAQFTQEDKAFIRGARIALHLPRHISESYVRDLVNIPTSKETTYRLAGSYIDSDKRGTDFKQYINIQSLHRPTFRQKYIRMTPINRLSQAGLITCCPAGNCHDPEPIDRPSQAGLITCCPAGNRHDPELTIFITD